LIKFFELWGAGNLNNGEEIHNKFGGTKRANVYGRHKGLNEILLLKLLW
jgi:hypothetical protein